MVIDGELRNVRFEISQDGGDSYFTRFDVVSDHLCQCMRELIVSSVLGKPLRTLRLDALAFALGSGYEGFADHVQCLLAKAGRAMGPEQEEESTSEPR